MGKPHKRGKRPSTPSRKQPQITAESFQDLSPDEKSKIDGDVGLARHMCSYVLQALSARDGDTARLLHLAFDIRKGKSFDSQVNTVQTVYKTCAETLQDYSFKVDSRIGGPCISQDLLACHISGVPELEKVIVLSDVPDLHDYFAADHAYRAAKLIHEFVHAIGVDNADHPGGIRDLAHPPDEDKDLIPFAQASHNAYCYENFAKWITKGQKLE